MIPSQHRLQQRADAAEAEPWPPQWMLDLERAHDRLGRAAHLLESGAQSGPVDLRPPAEALQRVYGGIFDAFDERRPRFDAAQDAVAALDEAVKLLKPAATGDAAVGFALDYLQEVHVALTRALERLGPLVPRPVAPAPELRAAFERPTLHAIDRSSLVPHLAVPSPTPLEVDVVPLQLERPKTFEEMEQTIKEMKERALAPKPPRLKKGKPPPAPKPESPPGFTEDIRPALSEQQFLYQRVRGCFEDVTMVGVQRAPLLGDPWRFSRTLERRMLWSIDAIVAMGPPALEALESLVFDFPLKDPPRIFATAMILGSVEGRDALGMAERVFLACEMEDPQHAAHFGAALKLVSHPYLPLLLRNYLSDGDPVRRALAIDVLSYRGMATPDELARAGQDEADVAVAALPWLAMTKHPSVRAAIDAAIEGPVARLRTAARVAMVLSGDFRAATALREALAAGGEEGESAASLLGIIAGPTDAEVLLEHARAAPSRASVAAIGWAGAKASVPALMALLEHADEPVVLAAAYALDRITNAGLYDMAIVEEDEIMVPDIPEPDLGDKPAPPPLARVISDPRDMPGEPSTDTLQRPTTDVARWAAWWKKNGDAYEAKARHRRGFPYTPYTSWLELDRWPCTPGERRLLHWELIARTGHYERFDTLDFVPVQEDSVAAWQPLARNASGSPGAWSLAVRRG